MSTSAIDVSIVLTVYNHWSLSRACLDSIYRSAEQSSLRAEVIVSDDCSTDETSTAWQVYLGRRWPIRYFRNEKNLGYLRNANRGASYATGEYLCTMNNDIVVQGNWLELLLHTIRSSPRIGLVGPKYLSPSGRTLECGVIVRADGTVCMMGHECDADDPRFSFLNDVDYCSMACTLTPMALFNELKGYDERYVPSYYEDTDYCFRLEDAGYRILVNPEIRVIHAHGATLIQQDRSGWLPIIAQHRELFTQRWAARLETRQPGPGVPEARYRSWRRKPAYVFHSATPLDSADRGTQGGLVALAGHIRSRGWHAVVVAPPGGTGHSTTLALQWEGVEVHRPRSLRQMQWLVRELTAAHSIEVVVLSQALESGLVPIYTRWAPGALRIPESQITSAMDSESGALALTKAMATARHLRESQPEAEVNFRAAQVPAATLLERRWGDPQQFHRGAPPYGGQSRAVGWAEQRIQTIRLRPVRMMLKLVLWAVTMRLITQARSRIAVSAWFGPGGRVSCWIGGLRPRWVAILAQRVFCAITLQPVDRFLPRDN